MKNQIFRPKGNGPRGYRPTKTKRIQTFDMLVIRNYNNRLAESKCCADCIKVLQLFGIRRVYYSNGDGNIVCEKVKDITNNKSSGRK